DAARRDLRAERDPRFVVIRNGVPIPPEPAPRPAGAPWLSVGRLHPQKGHDVLIEAWRRLGPAAPPLRIAGKGPLEADLRARAAGLGPAARARAAREFAVEAMISAWDRLYQSILSGRSGSTS